MAKIAGIESIANTTSVVSMTTNTASSGVAHTTPPKMSERPIQTPLQVAASLIETSCASRWKNNRSTASIARMNAITAAHAHHSTVMCDVTLSSPSEWLDDVLRDQANLVD